MKEVKTISNKPYTLKEYFFKLFHQREMLTVLVRREFVIKYANTLIGIGWFVLQPLVLMITYTLFFGILLKVDSNGIHYVPFVFSGLIYWNVFSSVVIRGGFALLESSELILKTSIPRLLILLAKTIPIAVENMILMVMMFLITHFVYQELSITSLWAIFYFFSTYLFALSLAIFMGPVLLKLRDLAHLIPILINFGIWITPVFYSTSIIPKTLQPLFLILNPIASNIESARNCLFKQQSLDQLNLIQFILTIILLFASLIYYVRFEKHVSEKI